MNFETRLYAEIGVIIFAMMVVTIGIALFIDWYVNRKEK